MQYIIITCISSKGLLQECDKEENVAVTVGCYCFLFQKQTVKRSAQCHIFAQSPPARRPNDKYPVNTSHLSDLRKNVSLQCYLVAKVIRIQSVRCQGCIYRNILHNIEKLVGQKK